MLLDGSIDGSADIIFFGHITAHILGQCMIAICTQFTANLQARIVLDVGNENLGAVAMEELGCSQAKSTGSTCYYRYSALQPADEKKPRRMTTSTNM